MDSKKPDANDPFIPDGRTGISAFNAGTDGMTLRLILDDPRKTVVWIKSQDAWNAYSLPGRKKPACTYKPASFTLLFEDGSSLHWTAKLAHDPETGDLALYELIRQKLS